MAPMTPSIGPVSLDAIREQLDRLADAIIAALKRRHEFPQNPAVYSHDAGLVKGFPRRSLLIHHVMQLERSDAASPPLGRLQEPFSDRGVEAVRSAERSVTSPPDNPFKPLSLSIQAALLGYYQRWIERCCTPGEAPEGYRETVVVDAEALLALSERIHLGELVAECKLATARAEFEATLGAEAPLRTLISRPQREQEVFDNVRQLAQRRGFPVDQAEAWWRWIIDTTIAVEIRYIRHRLGFQSPAALA